MPCRVSSARASASASASSCEFSGGGGAHTRCNTASGLGKLTILPSKRWWPIRSVGLPLKANAPKKERERQGERERVFRRGNGDGECTHLAVVVDCKTADELPVLVAGDVELALELEEDELG